MKHKLTALVHYLSTATILGASLFSAGSAFALTTQQVAEKLASIPVYTMGILQGERVTFLQETLTKEGGQEFNISRIYMNPKDAQQDLEALKSGKTQLPPNVAVAQVSLGEVYCISQQNQAKPVDRCDQQPQTPELPPAFIYFPDRGQLNQAIDMLKKQGVQIDDKTPLFVPLFLAQFKAAGQPPRTAPAIYFSLNNLQTDIATAKTQQPKELANVDISVQVTTLARVLEQLKAQDSPDLKLVEFVPQRPDNETPAQPGTPNGATPKPGTGTPNGTTTPPAPSSNTPTPQPKNR
jgi:hypothetical protein